MLCSRCSGQKVCIYAPAAPSPCSTCAAHAQREQSQQAAELQTAQSPANCTLKSQRPPAPALPTADTPHCLINPGHSPFRRHTPVSCCRTCSLLRVDSILRTAGQKQKHFGPKATLTAPEQTQATRKQQASRQHTCRAAGCGALLLTHQILLYSPKRQPCSTLAKPQSIRGACRRQQASKHATSVGVA